jgi:hypothetical protein
MQSHTFFDADVRTVEVADLGTVVSVSLVTSVDVGYTSFSLHPGRLDDLFQGIICGYEARVSKIRL